MALFYIFVIILKTPFLVLRYMIRNKVLLVIVIMGVIAGVVFVNITKSGAIAVPDYIKSAPSTPYACPTTTRLYYVNAYADAGEQWLLTDFYEYDNKEWVRRSLPLTLDKDRSKIITR